MRFKYRQLPDVINASLTRKRSETKSAGFFKKIVANRAMAYMRD